MMDGFEFNDVYITPFSELLDNPRGLSFHRGGPIWPSWEQQIEVRHRHRDAPVDDKPLFEPSDNIETINTPLLWCGPITQHYGHQIADFLTRLPAYKEKDGLYCFSPRTSSSIKTLSDTPRFFQDMLKWYNIPEDRVLIVSKPILAKKLFCLPQQERLTADGGIPPSQEYLDILTENTIRNGLATENKNGTYFISRAAMSAKLAGEGYLDYFLATKGIKVIRPETISLHEQLRIYSSAERLIFSEGSALHTLQLLGRGLWKTKIHIINRRPGTRLVSNILKSRCNNLQYHDLGTLIHGLNLAGRPAKAVALTVADKKELFTLLHQLEIDTKGWSDTLCNSFIKDDIKVWFDKERSSKRAKVPGSLPMIYRKLSSVGIDVNEIK
ncbi:hypothetical protein C7H85_04340 [Zobellella endophytica]|uniref:Glycosyltransferase 61 catalytic domain-containing protein n=1 Tax=Zobellella endophytica TaxID=2116700 RepID=A0A2P7RCV9_9GAMM|nr:glycosyltransferase 61 family protein [Zobellella endophytica]PSJ48033.1 hypothetical protein C7H85_04340 [Zobellella endophytica]